MDKLAEYFKKATRFISAEIKSESRSIAARQLNLTSRKLDTFAEALREAAGKLREKHSYSLADIMEICSESMMRLSNNVRVTRPGTIVGEIEDFARNKPGVFLGAAFVAGIFLGQLFSSPGEQDETVLEIQSRKESSI